MNVYSTAVPAERGVPKHLDRKAHSEPEIAIHIQNLEKRFDKFLAVDNISLSVPRGAFLVLLGPSGCGKTTMLRMLAGLEHPTGGEIYFGGDIVASATTGVLKEAGQRDAGLVFQSYALWPHMSVRGNVEWPLKVARWDPKRRRERVQEVLSFLGILALADRYPGEISGGQQQRVAIARTLAPGPSILLFDEPLSNLDAKLRVEMRAELLRIHRATGATSVYVTHDQVEAMTMATHVAVMKDGRVEQLAPPHELLRQPASPFVATFVGTPPGNLMPVEVRDGRFYFQDLELCSASVKGSARLLYRPEEVRVDLEPTGRSLMVELIEATPMAGRYVVTGSYRGDRLSAVSDTLPSVDLGETLFFTFPEAPAAVYPDDQYPVGSLLGGKAA